jgi:hypothetical protein
VILQEGALLQSGEELKRKQDQINIEAEQMQKEIARRSAAEQSVKELRAKTVLLTDERTKLDAQVKEAQSLAAENSAKVVSTESELEVGKLKIQELTEQTAQLTSESVELKRAAEQEARLRALLEVQMDAEREQARQMSVRIEELLRERSQLEIKLENETSSAAKGMELLLIAQEKLSSVFKSLGSDAHNGRYLQPHTDASVADSETKTEAGEAVQPASVGS